MGLSRNKVAVSEGAAGSPPFYGERATDLKDAVVKRLRLTRDENSNGLLFNFQGVRLLERKKLVLQTQRVHLFPFRTQKLSSAVAKILCGKPHGKIAQCQHDRGSESVLASK